MKQSLLLVLLFGFGYIAPWSCSKKQASDEEKTEHGSEKKQPTISKKQMVLFGPVHTIRAGQKA